MLAPNSSTKFAKKNRETILPSKTAMLISDAIAVLLFALSIILAVMLITYSPLDQCWFRISDMVTVHNKFGKFGSYVSDIIFSIFGISGWWLVIGLFYLGYRKIIRNKVEVGSWYSILKFISFLLLLASSAAFEYLNGYFSHTEYLHNGFGGMLGKTIFTYLLISIGQFGTAIFTFTATVALFLFAFNVNIITIAEKVGLFLEIFYIALFKLISRKDPQIEVKQKNIEPKDHEPEFNDEDIEPTISIANNLDPIIDEDDVIDKEVSSVKSMLNKITRTKTIKPKQVKVHDELELFDKELPDTSLLSDVVKQADTVSAETIDFISVSIENKLSEFGVEAKVINAEAGPVITRYELLPSRGVRGDKIVGLGKEIARGLAITNVRIVETIPGKNSMGIEVPNFKRQIIYLKEIFDSSAYRNSSSKLTMALGKDIAGDVIVTDLAKMPHLLVAGTTGSGKSVAVNVMILSILFQATPEEVKFIMIDPKMVELSFYQDIPHLLAPVVTDMEQAANALKWAVIEMERRYKIMAKFGAKNIVSFNQKIQDLLASGVTPKNPLSPDPENPEDLNKWPYIVVIIDELADLMMVTGKKIEQYIARIAQKARAVGIHLIVATQRPSVDVITGLIKANIPARISFQVSSKIDSRTVLDQMGAETLLGQGDMLFLPPGSGFPQRIHGAYVNDDELHKVVEFLKSKGSPDYCEEILSGGATIDGESGGLEEDSGEDSVERDAIFDEAVKFIYDSKRCSISSLQTRFGIGYNRAARIMTHLETIGMVRRNERGGFELLKTTSV